MASAADGGQIKVISMCPVSSSDCEKDAKKLRDGIREYWRGTEELKG
jgi:hypothetical protein